MTVSKSRFKCDKCKDCGFISKIVDDREVFYECDCRIKSINEKWLRNSGLDYEEYSKLTLANFKEDTEVSKSMKKTALDFLSDNEAKGCGFFGKSGIGKTHICIAICQELTTKRRLMHKYFDYRGEIQKLNANIFNDEQYEEIMYKWSNCPVLYIDDLFKFASGHKGVNEQELRIMWSIINTRYINKKITIFSSELTVSQIREIDEALASRIYSMVDPYGLKCVGENRRFKK